MSRWYALNGLSPDLALLIAAICLKAEEERAVVIHGDLRINAMVDASAYCGGSDAPFLRIDYPVMGRDE